MGCRVVVAGLAALSTATLVACSPGGDPEPTTSTPSSTTSTSTSTSAVAASCSAGAAPALSGTRTAYATAAPLNSTHALAGQVGTPTLSSSPSNQPGWDIAIVPVSAQVQTNGIFAVSPTSFVLIDAAGQRCPQAPDNPSQHAFTIIQVDESHPGSGDVAFLVPHGADLSAYSVLYTEQSGGKVAIAEWASDGPSPTATTAAGCDGSPSQYAVSKLRARPFGTSQRFGSGGTYVDIAPTAPSLRDLPPSDRQPSDVDGLALQVTVTAGGSIGFVDRAQFQLVDSRGMLCRYGSLGSSGETLSTDLVPAGQSKTYTVIFWLPRGSSMASWRLLYLKEPSTGKVSAVWTGTTVPSSSPTATTSAPGSATPSPNSTSPKNSTPTTPPPARG